MRAVANVDRGTNGGGADAAKNSDDLMAIRDLPAMPKDIALRMVTKTDGTVEEPSALMWLPARLRRRAMSRRAWTVTRKLLGRLIIP